MPLAAVMTTSTGYATMHEFLSRLICIPTASLCAVFFLSFVLLQGADTVVPVVLVYWCARHPHHRYEAAVQPIHYRL